MSGVEVDPASLAEASKGIESIITELNGIGIAGSGEMGRGLSQLALSGLEAGHDGLKSALDTFTSRWSWGVRTLVQDAQGYAVGLGLSAGMYHDIDDYVGGTFKELGASFVADPHLTGDQIQKESWSQMLSDATTPDYSAESFEDAGDQAADTWKAEGRDLSEGGPTGQLIEDLTGTHEQMEQARDDVFGPAPTQDGE